MIATRSYFSTHLLAAAEDAAAAAARTEQASPHPVQRFSLEHRGQVLSAIVLSVAFMEAAINEIFQDAAEGHITDKLEAVDQTTIRSWAALWEALAEGASGSALNRYQAGLIAANQPIFDRGVEPWQSAQFLVQVRNHLIHFRPETVTKNDPQKLVQGLRSKVGRNPLASNEWDLDGWLSASCASWAVNSARGLMEAFASSTCEKPNYQLALAGLRANNP